MKPVYLYSLLSLNLFFGFEGKEESYDREASIGYKGTSKSTLFGGGIVVPSPSFELSAISDFFGRGQEDSGEFHYLNNC